MRPLILVLTALAALAAPSAAPAQDPAAGSFGELTGAAGCLVQSGALTDNYYDPGENALEGCAKGRGLFGSRAVTLSPDGRNAYVAASGTRRFGSSAVVTLARDTTTGHLAFTECISDDGGDGRLGSDGLCANGDALLGAADVVLSADGRFAYVPAAGSNGLAWFAREEASGRLTQLGCFKEVPRKDNCAQAPALMGAVDAALSPDGAHLYVASNVADAVSIFSRDAETGALTPAGCVSNTGSDGACADATALRGASSVVVSADGADVYVTAAEVGAVTWYARDAATGALTPKGCLLQSAVEGGACSADTGLDGAAEAALTPDGRQLLVAARDSSALLVFSRDAQTGAVTRTACLQHQAARGDDVIPDEEEEEYDEEFEDFEDEEEDAEDARVAQDEEEEFEEDEETLTEGCTPARALSSIAGIAVSADGTAVFAVGSESLAAFRRDPQTGALTQFACAEQYRSYRSCTQSRALSGPAGLTASADGRNLYVADSDTGAVATYGAVTAVTSRAARLARDGSTAVRLACPAARSAACRGRIAVAVVRRHARGHRYALAPGASARVRVKVPRHVRRAVARRRSARVTLVLRDARRETRLGGRRITLRR